MVVTNKLDKAQIAEIKDLYDGSWASIMELSFDFRVSVGMIARIVNHKNAHLKELLRSKKWRKANPDKAKKLCKLWYQKHRKEVLAKYKEKYWENPEASRKKGRDTYHRNKK